MKTRYNTAIAKQKLSLSKNTLNNKKTTNMCHNTKKIFMPILLVEAK